MPKTLKDRVEMMQTALDTHLQESGSIKTDLAWLKKAFWALVSAGLSFNVMLAIYLLSRGKN